MSLSDVCSRIAAAELRTSRAPGAVQLIAVSKVQPEDRVTAVLDAGHRLFGENRVQEAQSRWTPLRARYDDVVLHLIGPLQTNKVKQTFDLFDAIQTLDRDKLARRIAVEAQGRGACPALFVQVNTGAEPQKAGILPAEADAFIAACRETYDLKIAGLMCIPPADEEPSPHFALLRAIAERNGVDDLSMGMSADFESAISLGATHVRVGSGVFGIRATG
jgi:pyridoxal phosphate enzyme (YggS family)